MDIFLKNENGWRNIIEGEFNKLYFNKLVNFIKSEYLQNKIYPAQKDIFRAFDFCPFSKVKVVILGQDPYHGEGQANGLCFSVDEKNLLPPSLRNIFKEIESDLKIIPKSNGDLSRWAKQGVFLLNATLTVRADNPGSHQKKGWEEFTDAVITKLSSEREGLVFMLWGNYAKKKGQYIDRNRHLVLEAQHPSPFSAHNGFLGCKHFSKANEYLKLKGLTEIDWS